MSSWLVAEAWVELLYVDLVSLRGFRALRDIVGYRPTKVPSVDVEQMRSMVTALEKAILLYLKPVLCLQRSVALTRLLRRHGIAADLVIGCHLAPMTAHAWVEVAGKAITQNPDGFPFLPILDRW
jgi:hypothetical protein